MKKFKTFPFVAVIGQEEIKKALILNVINPNISGVIISGEKGTAKSTLVRALSEALNDIDVVNLPLNITEDMLVGSIDLKETVLNGNKKIDFGLLKKANKNILYVDEVNLLSDNIINILLDVDSKEENIIEREGISYSHMCKFILIGSMNPEEGLLKPQFIDRFGLYVEAHSENTLFMRSEIIKRRLKYEDNPNEYINNWSKETIKLRQDILKAKELKNKIHVTDSNLKLAANLAKVGNCQGHRAEITIIETAIALASYYGRVEISDNDIKEAAKYALPHRIREGVQIEENDISNDTSDISDEINNTESNNLLDKEEVENSYQSLNETKFDSTDPLMNMSDDYEDIKPTNTDISLNLISINKKNNYGSGKRLKIKSNSRKGRYVKFRIPNKKTNDIAIDATLRSAAIHSRGKKLSVKSSDIREKVRERRTGATILFVVDASASMGAKKRMGAVKGAVVSLLTEAYQKRDSIGIIAFRNTSAQVLLNITRSADLAQKCLKQLKTGGKTPLAAGIYKAYEILKVEKIKNPEALQYVIIVSDGKANISMNSNNAFEDAINIGKKLNSENIQILILDTENSYIQYGLAKKLSEEIDAEYIKLTNINKNEVKSSVSNFIK